MPQNMWPQLIVILVILSLSAISWVVRKLQEQHRLRQFSKERERRELSLLRSGRETPDTLARTSASPVPTQPVPTQASNAADDIARRRRAQIAELRRRTAQRTDTPSAPATQPEPTTTIRLPGGIILNIPGSAGPTVPMPAPARATQRSGGPRDATRAQDPDARRRVAETDARRRQTQRRQEDERRQRLEAERRVARARATAEAEEASHAGESFAHRLVPNAPSTAFEQPVPGARPGSRGFGAGALAVRPATIEEWRRAFLLQEVLGRPLSER